MVLPAELVEVEDDSLGLPLILEGFVDEDDRSGTGTEVTRVVGGEGVAGLEGSGWAEVLDVAAGDVGATGVLCAKVVVGLLSDGLEGTGCE